MKGDVKHSPLPWQISGVTYIWSPGGHANVAAASDPRPPNNSSVGYFEIRPWDAGKDADQRFQEACANAELIVAAVNCYHQLIEALHVIRKIAGDNQAIVNVVDEALSLTHHQPAS